LLNSNTPGVISALKVRAFETAHSRPLLNWNQLQLKATFDYAASPQLSVPLGTLFGASGSLNDFRGAAIGRLPRHCYYEDPYLAFPKESMTGYFYLPMPYWQHADVVIEGDATITTSLSVCFEITIEHNSYSFEDTAYLHGHKTVYSGSVQGFRDILSLRGAWGHVIGVYMDVDNLSPLRGTALLHRWPALEADAVLFVDGQKSATMMGTGLEDYFSYAHGFMFAENTTYAFVGNYHASPRRTEPLTWYCYRQHIVDPIPFHNSVHFFMEGTSHFNASLPETPLLDWQGAKQRSETLLSHMVLFYSKKDATRFKRLYSLAMDDVRAFPQNTESFDLKKRRYIGASHTNISYDCNGRAFKSGDSLEFTFQLDGDFNLLVLRRNFYATPKMWNEEAHVFVNGRMEGTWFISMGALNELFSLRQEDFFISNLDPTVSQISVRLEPQTVWKDCGYEVYGVL
jgi:hypothetical protein